MEYVEVFKKPSLRRALFNDNDNLYLYLSDLLSALRIRTGYEDTF